MGRARACTPLLAKLNKCLIKARAGASRCGRGRLTTRHGLRLPSYRLAPSWRGAVLPGRGPQESGERLHWGPKLSLMGPVFWEGPKLQVFGSIFLCLLIFLSLTGCSSQQVAERLAAREQEDASACRSVQMDYAACRQGLI